MMHLRWAITGLAIGTCCVLNAGDKSSVVDYMKATGRNYDFSARAEQYQRIHPGNRYSGSTEQNRELRSGKWAPTPRELS
mgnify:CR=1 FL=1